MTDWGSRRWRLPYGSTAMTVRATYNRGRTDHRAESQFECPPAANPAEIARAGRHSLGRSPTTNAPETRGQSGQKCGQQILLTRSPPKNPDIRHLAKTIGDHADEERSQNDIALQFTNGNEKKARSLLRQSHRDRHLVRSRDDGCPRGHSVSQSLLVLLYLRAESLRVAGRGIPPLRARETLHSRQSGFGAVVADG